MLLSEACFLTVAHLSLASHSLPFFSNSLNRSYSSSAMLSALSCRCQWVVYGTLGLRNRQRGLRAFDLLRGDFVPESRARNKPYPSGCIRRFDFREFALRVARARSVPSADAVGRENESPCGKAAPYFHGCGFVASTVARGRRQRVPCIIASDGDQECRGAGLKAETGERQVLSRNCARRYDTERPLFALTWILGATGHGFRGARRLALSDRFRCLSGSRTPCPPGGAPRLRKFCFGTRSPSPGGHSSIARSAPALARAPFVFLGLSFLGGVVWSVYCYEFADLRAW